MYRIGAFLGLVGGALAVVCVVSGFMDIGADPLYQSRMGFGVAALALGIIAGISGFLPRLHPAAASVLMFVAGTLGFLATLPWYINTFYIAALPLWIVGAALMLAAGFAPRRA
jgi:hypothetical protein